MRITSDGANPSIIIKNLYDTAGAQDIFAGFLALVDAAGFRQVLLNSGPWTLLAPTDEALERLPLGTSEMLRRSENGPSLKTLIRGHLISGRISAADMDVCSDALSSDGQRLPIVSKGGRTTIGGARVVISDIPATNGLIHAIDTIMAPSQ